jgi:hypothetical protein
MSHNTPEQLDEIIRLVQNHEDVSILAKPQHDPSSTNLVSVLANMPKAQIDKPNLLHVRNKILDRISLPSEAAVTNGLFVSGWTQYLPRLMRITGGVLGAFTIMLGLTIGTAAAALESVPGQTIYPLKKMVETFQLQLASTEAEKANLQIKFANNRVDELATIIKKKKAGQATDDEVKKAVESTVKNLEETSQAIANQTETESKTELYTKIVSLSDKQAAVIMSAQTGANAEVQADLAKALESSKISKEQAIENIERAGLNIEDTLLLSSDDQVNHNQVVAEGALTIANRFQISIGTSQFLLTSDTEYANIGIVDLKVGTPVIIHGEVRNNKTYAVKIEPAQIPEPSPTPSPQPTPTDTPTVTPSPTDQTGSQTENPVPLNP